LVLLSEKPELLIATREDPEVPELTPALNESLEFDRVSEVADSAAIAFSGTEKDKKINAAANTQIESTGLSFLMISKLLYKLIDRFQSKLI
jgi:hypothetical protein